MRDRPAKKRNAPRSAQRKVERVPTPFGRLTLCCAKPEEMDKETLATLERGLTATIRRRRR